MNIALKKVSDIHIWCLSVGPSLQIWDTAGQERFQSITSSYYRGADGVLLVFDLTDNTSLDKLENWIDHIKEVRTLLIENLKLNRAVRDNQCLSFHLS